MFPSHATDETITKFSATIDLAEEGFDSTLATVVGTDSIAAVAAHVHGVQADAVGQVSNKRRARRNAMKSKHQKARLQKWQEIGGVVSQTEEGAKDWGDRMNSKFVHDLNPLCPDSESEAMNPITSASDDALVQEGVSHSMSTGDETARTDTAAASEIIGVETEAVLQGGEAILSTNTIVSAAPVDSALFRSIRAIHGSCDSCGYP